MKLTFNIDKAKAKYYRLLGNGKERKEGLSRYMRRRKRASRIAKKIWVTK